jgi:hypothetical protein
VTKQKHEQYRSPIVSSALQAGLLGLLRMPLAANDPLQRLRSILFTILRSIVSTASANHQGVRSHQGGTSST